MGFLSVVILIYIVSLGEAICFFRCKKKEQKEPASRTNHVDIDKTGNVHVDHSDKARNEHGDPNHIAQKKPIDPEITDKKPEHVEQQQPKSEHVEQQQPKSLLDRIGSAFAGLFHPKPKEEKGHSDPPKVLAHHDAKENGEHANASNLKK